MTDVEIYEPNNNGAVEQYQQPGTYELLWRLANRVAHTDFVPSAFRGKPEAVLAAFVTGAENGNGPMQSLRMYQVIQGSVGLKPEAMRAEVAKAGHLIETVDYTDTKVTLHGKRADNGQEETVTWTLDDAKRAGLKGDNWTKYPRAMMLARATSELCRLMFSDVTLGLAYNADELEEIAPAPRPPSHTRELPDPRVDTETGEIVERAAPEVMQEKVAEARSAIRRAPGRKAAAPDVQTEAGEKGGQADTHALSVELDNGGGTDPPPAAKPGALRDQPVNKFPAADVANKLRGDIAALPKGLQDDLRKWLAAEKLPTKTADLDADQLARVVDYVRQLQRESEAIAAEMRV